MGRNWRTGSGWARSGQEVQAQPYIDYKRAALDTVRAPCVETRLHLGASVLRLCIVVD